jgi:hypothetical protein
MIFEKRPAEELYDVQKDPDQTNNVAGQPKYAAVQRGLSARLEQWMRNTADPRTNSATDVWDYYPYYAPGVLNGKKPAEPYAPR